MLFPPPPGIHPEKASPPAAGIGLALRQTASREKYRVQTTGVETDERLLPRGSELVASPVPIDPAASAGPR